MVKQTSPVAEPMQRPTICVTLSGCSVDEILADAARATAVGADLCEVRLDMLWVVEKVPELKKQMIPIVRTAKKSPHISRQSISLKHLIQSIYRPLLRHSRVVSIYL